MDHIHIIGPVDGPTYANGGIVATHVNSSTDAFGMNSRVADGDLHSTSLGGLSAAIPGEIPGQSASASPPLAPDSTILSQRSDGMGHAADKSIKGPSEVSKNGHDPMKVNDIQESAEIQATTSESGSSGGGGGYFPFQQQDTFEEHHDEDEEGTRSPADKLIRSSKKDAWQPFSWDGRLPVRHYTPDKWDSVSESLMTAILPFQIHDIFHN